MSDNIKYGLVAAVVALVVAFGVVSVAKPTLPAGVLVDAGSAAPSYGATSASFSATVFSHLSNLQVNGNLSVVGDIGWGGDANTGTYLHTIPVIGTCNTASSTVFSIATPAASSTLLYFQITGTQGATTTDFVIATSTVASPAYTTTTATSSLNENIMGINVAASAQFTSVAGVTLGGDANYTNPANKTGFVSNAKVGLAPSTFIIGFSTSTAPGGAGGRGAAQVAVPKSCTYKAIIGY